VHSLRFGLALHLGEVLYGCGGTNRLDFTCIGSAVNLTARLEKLAGTLGLTVILSAEFANYVDTPLDNLGDFEIARFAAKQKAFGLRS